MDIITDNSTQSISSLANVNGTYNPFITASDLTTSLATKQDTLTAGTTLLGVGSSISALDYGKITLNVPTYFPTSWANVASKPSIFPSDWANVASKPSIFPSDWANVASKPSIFPSDWTNVSGKPTEFTANWNTTITNKPSIFPSDWTNVSGKPTEFTANWNTTITNKPSIFPSDWTNVSGKPTEFTANWNTTITNKPDLTIYNAWTKTNNDIYTTITGGNVGIGTNVINASYRLNVVGNLNASALYIGGTQINFSSYQPIINTYSITGPTGGSLSFASGTLTLAMPTTYTALSIASLTSATSILYKGAEISSSYLKLDGTNNMVLNAGIALTGTGKFSGDGSLITAINYNNITGNALSFQTPLSKSPANLVSIDLSDYSPMSVNDTRYLRLNGANEMANTLNIRILNQYAIDIQTIDSTSINCIAFKNNTTSYAFIGLPGTTYGGNYQNNLFLQTTNAIIFNTGNTTTNGTPRMIIMSNGNIGIGTNSTTAKLDVRGLTTTENLSVVDATSYTNQFQLIINPPTGLTATANSGALIQTIKQGIGYDQNIMLQRDGGTVTIGTNTPRSSATKLTISGSSSTYSQPLVRIVQNLAWNGNYALEVIGGGTATTGGAYVNFNGIRINGLDTGNTIYQDTLNGNMGFAVNPTNTTGGNITLTTYGAAGNIKFYTNGANERMTIQAGGNVNINNALTVGADFRVYNGAGQIRGVSSYANIATSMATGSLTIGDTSKSFGGGTNWNTNVAGLLMECQNNTEIAIHDADTRIASFMYYVGGTNQFYIGRDMGWGTIAQTNFYGNINIINSLTNKLIFDDYTNNTKIQLFSGYSFGINASTLRYDSAGVHKFNTNNNQTFIIDANGNTRATGNMVASAYSTASRYYCSATTLLFTSIVSGGATVYGWFLHLNSYWYTGYSYLTISASVNMASFGNIFCWNGRVYLSAAYGLITVGGVLQITTDYRNPVAGDNAINVEERWDGAGNNYLRFYGTNLNAGVLTIKVYG